MLVQHLASEPLALPLCKIGVLNRQLFEWRFPALAEGFVERAYLAHQNALRPTIRDDVMDRQQQHVFFRRKLHEAGAQQGTAGQVEWLTRLFRGEL